MGIYQALELMNEKGEGTGLYHYTCTNSQGSHAVGYCSPWEVCPDCKGHSGILRRPGNAPCERCNDKGILHKENHCKGHETPQGASQHYQEYLIDNAKYDGTTSKDVQHKCEVCGSWTQGIAMMGEWRQFHLCDEHRNRAGLEQVVIKKN